MSKFKVGDRVRCVDAEGASELSAGAQYTVASCTPERVWVEGKCGGWYLSRFERIDEPTTAFKVGDRVRYVKGQRRGEVGTITSLNRTAIVTYCRLDGALTGWPEDYFQKVEGVEPTPDLSEVVLAPGEFVKVGPDPTNLFDDQPYYARMVAAADASAWVRNAGGYDIIVPLERVTPA